METSIIIPPEAKSIIIKTNEDLSRATIILTNLNKMHDKLVEDREKMTAPINLALKEIRAKYKPMEEGLNASIEHIRTQMSAFRTRQDALQQKIADKVSSGAISIEKAVMKLSVINQEVAGLKFREMQVLKIINSKIIPREYLVPDEKRILEDLKLGKKIKGAELEIKNIPVNSRN